MASASDPPAHPALQPADRLILPPQHPPAAVETSIGPPHYPAECTHSHASVQPSLRARTGHANSDSFLIRFGSAPRLQTASVSRGASTRAKELERTETALQRMEEAAEVLRNGKDRYAAGLSQNL